MTNQLQYELNRAANTLSALDVPTLAETEAANVYAATTGNAMVGALNIKAGRTNPSTFVGLREVLNELAGTTNLDVCEAAANLPALP